ncbi:GC-rich sequence DNA-binding factor 2 [Nematolebias whitei]|uniref:GC-rich sequence DNA-binding factor 2 n=1 Tax=Nematolebias whitei TaxID=451745 RepID=UPI0018971398|nr:GC-rich sequence DNA-binding factor 2 [Nematolebias whitei]
MFNKRPRKNFRQRKKSSSDDEDKETNSGEGDENQKAPAATNKPPKATQGRGISCCSKREATPPQPDSSDGEDGGKTLEVTEERREEDIGTRKATNSVLSFSDDKEVEKSFELKRSSDKAVLFQVRKKEAPSAKTSKGGVSISSSSSPRHIIEASPHSLHNDNDEYNSNTDDSDARSQSTNSDSDSSHSSTKPSTVIPNADEIDVARKQRRAARVQKEFIPLSRDGRSSAGSTPSHNSRDDDDDDDDDEADDHKKRIEFAPRMKSIRERIAEKLGGSDGSLSSTDAEEQELWEQTQIEKGVKRRPGEQSPSGSEASSCSRSSRQSRRAHKKRSAGLIVPKMTPPVSVSMIKRRITGKLDSLKEVHRAWQADLRRMEGDVENAKSSLEILEETSSENQLKFYRTTTLYVHNLVECLREKIVEINSLELELHTLLSDHTEALLAQRRKRIQEQAESLQQLSYNTDEQNGSSAKETDVQSKTSLYTEDDFELHKDTKASSEEEEQLQKKIADIHLRSQTVFSDVQDDFCNVKKILSRFEEWRRSYSESYHNAYISLCLPKLLNPIIRHQLLGWNPLKDVCGEFENHPWFTAVETFCHGHDHDELEHTDRQTLSNVIEKCLLPKIAAFVELVWDPMSHQQSACLSGVCHRLKEDYSIFVGEQSKPVKGFIEAVGCRMRSCVDEDVFIPLYPKRFLEDRSSSQRRFRDEQFWTAVKLLENMGKWDLLLPEPVLKELMLDKLLNRYLMITLCSQTLSSRSAACACKKIADCLPLTWFIDESVSLPQLQNFRNYIVQKVHSICKQEPPQDPNTRSAVTEELKVLSRIRCYDSIMAVAEKYHYEDIVYSHQLLNQETV